MSQLASLYPIVFAHRHRFEKTSRFGMISDREATLHIARVPAKNLSNMKSFPILRPRPYLSRFVTHADKGWTGTSPPVHTHTHVVYREVNDSCRQFVHKHVPVTLLERAIRNGADGAGRSLRARTCSPSVLSPFPACLTASCGRCTLPTSAAEWPKKTACRSEILG